MKHKLVVSFEPNESPTASVLAEFSQMGVTSAVARLRGWALIRGATITGFPFIRLHSNFSVAVHLPVLGRIRPNVETGVALDESTTGDFLALTDVEFGEIRTAARELISLAGQGNVRGPAEFRPRPSGFAHGEVLLPVDSPPLALPSTVALPAVQADPLPPTSARGAPVKISQILVPLDGSPASARAIPVAAAIADRLDARLHLVHAITASLSRSELQRRRRLFAEYASRLLQVPGPLVARSTDVIVGAEPEVIAEASLSADMIVLASRGQDSIKSNLIGNVTDKVLRGTHLPVVVVPVRGAARQLTDRRMLVALDGSESAELGLELARSLASRLGMTIRLLRAYLGVRVFSSFEFAYAEPTATDAECDAAKAYLEDVKHAGEEVEAVFGSPVEAICAAASRADAGLIVMTSSGKGLAARIALGSCTSGVVHLADRPVLIVPA